MLQSILEILLRARGGTQTKQELGKVQKSVKSLNGLVKELGLALGLAGVTGAMVIFGKQSFKMAGQAERLGRATDNLARSIGSSGDAMVKSIQDASKGMINQVDAMTAANKAMMFGIVENEDQMKELATVAIVLGQAMGVDATTSVNDLTTALGRQQPLILDNLGITLKLEEAYSIYARQLGKTVEDLTEVERKQAFVNAALEKGRIEVEKLGGEVTPDMTGQVEALTAAWADFKIEFGELLEVSPLLDQMIELVKLLRQGAEAYQQAQARYEAGPEMAKVQQLAQSTAFAALLTPRFMRPKDKKDIELLAEQYASWAVALKLTPVNIEDFTRELEDMNRVFAMPGGARGLRAMGIELGEITEAAEEATDSIEESTEALDTYKGYAKEAARLEAEYAQERQDTVDEYGKRRVQMETSYASQREQALEDFTRQQDRQLRDYQRREQQAEQAYYQQRQARAEAFSQQMAQMEADHQKKMSRMREDYDMRQEDAVASRDAIAFLRNQRQYEVSRRRAEQDYGDAASQRSEEYGRQLVEQEEQFAKQRDQRMADFDQRTSDQQADFDQRRQREAEQHQEMMAQYDSDHQERLADMETAFADEKQARDDAFADELSAQDVWLGDWSERWREGEAQLEEDYEAFLKRMRSLTSGGGPVHGRQAGGYAGFGMYQLGEAGREFVMSAGTTQAAEMMSGGGLTQEGLLAGLSRGSFNNNSSIVVNEATTPPIALAAMIDAQINDALTRYARGY